MISHEKALQLVQRTFAHPVGASVRLERYIEEMHYRTTWHGPESAPKGERVLCLLGEEISICSLDSLPDSARARAKWMPLPKVD